MTVAAIRVSLSIFMMPPEFRSPPSPPGIGVKLLPRDVLFADHPGHLGVTWTTGHENEREYRGFRFRLLDLPEFARLPSQWRSYLFDNKVRGYVTDDIMLRDAVAQHGGKLLSKEWPAQDKEVKNLENSSAPGLRGWYSFAPEQHADCNNCVTWAIKAVNEALGAVMPSIPNGRLKLAVNMLKDLEAEPSV